MTKDEILYHYGYNWCNYGNSENEKRCRKIIATELSNHTRKEQGTIKFLKEFRVMRSSGGVLKETTSFISYRIEYLRNDMIHLSGDVVLPMGSIGFDLGIELLTLIESNKFI